MQPIIQDINNAVLKGNKAMPIKDSTSDGTSSFVMGRMDYVRAYAINQKTSQMIDSMMPPQLNNVVSNINNKNIYTGRSIQIGGAAPLQKKWIGGTRDASQIIDRKRINGIAIGSLNASNGSIAFTTKNDPNTVREALHKVRSGGSCVPAKCTHKYPNPPIFY